jgi:hypothetical protein
VAAVLLLLLLPVRSTGVPPSSPVRHMQLQSQPVGLQAVDIMVQ